jgi:hypothetical protein
MGESEGEYSPGEGPAVRVSVSLRAGNVRAVRERVGARGFSAYVDAAVERQIERDLLEEALGELRDEAAELFRAVKSAPELQGDAGWFGHEAG